MYLLLYQELSEKMIIKPHLYIYRPLRLIKKLIIYCLIRDSHHYNRNHFKINLVFPINCGFRMSFAQFILFWCFWKPLLIYFCILQVPSMSTFKFLALTVFQISRYFEKKTSFWHPECLSSFWNRLSSQRDSMLQTNIYPL